jgi:cytochrome oxidase assembly protein ShyY1
VADPAKFDGTAPRDVDDLLDQADTLPAVVLADESRPAEPAALTADSQDPADAIVPVPPPELGEGPHLSYAVQWFIFTTIAVVGYPLILRRVLQRRGKEVDDGEAAGGPGPDGPDGADDLDRELAQLLNDGSPG